MNFLRNLDDETDVILLSTFVEMTNQDWVSAQSGTPTCYNISFDKHLLQL